MTSNSLEFDCDLRRAASHDVEPLRQIFQQATLEIYGRSECDRSLNPLSLSAEIAVVGLQTIGVAAFVQERLTCLYVVERFRKSGIGTCLLHNAMLSGVRAATVPSGKLRVLTFFERRGWRSHGEIVFDIDGEKLHGIAMHYGNRN